MATLKRRLAFLSLALVCLACSQLPPASGGTAPQTLVAAPSPLPPVRTSAEPDVFVLTLQRARMVRNLVSLIDAYNARDLDAVTALLVDDVIWADCDFRNASPISASGKADVAAFLLGRFTDHEQLEIARIESLNPDTPGGLALGVDYSHRTSDALKALGFPNGIKGPSGAKIVFAPDGRIRAVGHASIPGRPGDCQPR